MRSRPSAVNAFAAAWLLAAFAIAGCATTEEPAAAPEDVTYEMEQVEQTLRDCPEDLAPCASIALEFPQILAAPTEAARAAIDDRIQSMVLQPLEEGVNDATVEEMMNRFINGYRDFANAFPDASTQWVLTRRIDVIYNADGIFSLEASTESYTGGAHPNREVRLVSFDARTGRSLVLDDLFVEGYAEELTAVAERAFRKERGLGPEDDLSSAGFWFDEGHFELNENFAVVADGLRFYFNAYEIAPYVMGPTEVELPASEIASLLRPDGPLGGLAPAA